jgi:Uma2 family endonuclease
LRFPADDGIVVEEADMYRRMTTEEYFAGGEVLTPQELIWGVVRDAPSPTPRHQRAVVSLLTRLVEHVRARDLGEVFASPLDVVLDRERSLVVQPDLFFFAKGRLHLVADRVGAAPDLVIEILSPSPRIGTLNERLEWFAAYGVRECWLVHQLHQSIEVLEFADRRLASRKRFEASQPIASSLLPAFRYAFHDFVAAGW